MTFLPLVFFLLFFFCFSFFAFRQCVISSLSSLKQGVFGYLGRNITTNKGYDMGGKKSFLFLFFTEWLEDINGIGTSEQTRGVVDDEDDDGWGSEVLTPLSLDPSVHQGEISEERAFVSGELRFLA